MDNSSANEYKVSEAQREYPLLYSKSLPVCVGELDLHNQSEAAAAAGSRFVQRPD
jgi:hypothetical protein